MDFRIAFVIPVLAAMLAIESKAQPGISDQPEKIPVLYNTVYIPDGFDNNDNVQIVGEGLFSNTCYRPAQTTASVDEEQKIITLHPTGYHYSGMCAQVVFPWHQVADVGLLKAGTYKVVQNGDKEALGQVTIRVSRNPGPDDYLYAPISQVYLKDHEGTSTVTVSGVFSNSCLRVTELRVEVQSKVIVVQPITELQSRPDCVDGSFPFEQNVSFGSPHPGRYLLHVRSLNGKAFNNLVDIY